MQWLPVFSSIQTTTWLLFLSLIQVCACKPSPERVGLKAKGNEWPNNIWIAQESWATDCALTSTETIRREGTKLHWQNIPNNTTVPIASETNFLTHSIQQSPSLETNRFSASQEILSSLWNQKVHYQIHNSPPPVPTLSQINPFHAPITTFWRSILTLSSHLRLGLPSGLLPSGFPTVTLYAPLLNTCYMPRQSQSSWFDRQYYIWWAVRIIKLLSLHSRRTISEAVKWIFNWNYA
jgi:hypothetical protein